MKSKPVAPLSVRIFSCLMAFVLAIGLTPISINKSWASVAPFTATVSGNSVEDIAFEKDGYSYTPYGATSPETCGLYTITVPEGTEVVELNYPDNVLNYSYDTNGAFLGSYIESDPNGTVGAKHVDAKPYFNKDEVLDLIRVQTPYDSNYNSSLLYVIAFESKASNTDNSGSSSGDNEQNPDSGNDQTPGSNNGQNQNPETGTYSEADLNTLIANLSTRFSSSGAEAGINNGTWNAAVALNNKGAGNKISKEEILENLASEIDSIAPGTLAKYIVALTSAGVDCTNVVINGVSRNLIEQMDESMGEGLGDYGIYSYVCILPAYDFGGYEQTSKAKILKSQIIDEIIQQKGSLEAYLDIQTAAQVILALCPYSDDPDVEEAIESMEKIISNHQDVNGGFPGWSGISVDTTATVVAALCARGVNPAAVHVEGGANPIDYLISAADEDLNGYENAAASDEAMAASTALFGLVAYQKSVANGGTFYVYNKQDVGSQDKPQSNPQIQPENNGSSVTDNVADSDSSQGVDNVSGNGPKTGDSLVMYFALGIALLSGLVTAVSGRLRRTEQ